VRVIGRKEKISFFLFLYFIYVPSILDLSIHDGNNFFCKSLMITDSKILKYLDTFLLLVHIKHKLSNRRKKNKNNF